KTDKPNLSKANRTSDSIYSFGFCFDSGLIVLSNNLSYILEPLPESQEQHLIYRAEHLQFQRGTCGSQHVEANADWLTEFTITVLPLQIKREDLQPMKYVELLLVADFAEVREACSIPPLLFYKSLNIRIALVGLEVWNNRDMCDISENPYSTLWSFLAWRRKLLMYKKHDNAQLITGIAFHGTTIGLAPLMAMCSDYQSGGVNMDHSDNAIGVSATVAHEMGHNFGMSHDSPGCCTASPENGGCIMAAATGHPFPRVFNRCNRKELDRYLQSGGGMCLFNMPDTKTLYGGQRCGNGYLEEGEECDCGEVEECNNPCCNAANCSLKPGAECAHGTCCHQCKLVTPGTLCRESSRPCDLPEYCTGKSPFCPANFYQMDGTPCAGGRAYCYSGMCLTYEQQCLQLWGQGAKPAPDPCFEKVNAAGDSYGNCGMDINGRHRKCETRDAKCGKIQCQSSASKPVESNAVAIDTTITMNGKPIKCRGTHVYRAAEEGDMLDPGLVMTGTKCGDNHVCFEGQCRNTSFFETGDCETKCHGQGVCNNNHNCHCFSGWAPPYCNKPGNGGSVDNGPIPPQSGCYSLYLHEASKVLMGGGGGKGGCCCLSMHGRMASDASSMPEIPPKPPQLHSQPNFPVGVKQPPPLPATHNRKAPGPVHQLGMKDVARLTPPSRPAPTAPKNESPLCLPQDVSRPRPPQKALPANPVPTGHKATPGINTTALLPPTGRRTPGQHKPLTEVRTK
uniref:ADAM metallopeptidase domain 19 n=1 Tax=Sphenodon punctatus TaxID=8508 RepID=A0A8D0GRE8_SPHPU